MVSKAAPVVGAARPAHPAATHTRARSGTRRPGGGGEHAGPVGQHSIIWPNMHMRELTYWYYLAKYYVPTAGSGNPGCGTSVSLSATSATT
mgnify:CR=1 FL=1